MENKRANEEDEELKGEIVEQNWSERVEDFVADGDSDAAISFLESVVSNFESRLRFPSSSSSSGDVRGGERTEVLLLQLASSLSELADLYSSRGLSLKSDELRARSSLIKERALACEPVSSRDSGAVKNQSVRNNAASDFLNSDQCASSADGNMEKSTRTSSTTVTVQASSDDDWEAIADRDPSELLSLDDLPDISKLSVEEPKVEGPIAQGPKRRGRGTFTYNRNQMYSEQDYLKARFQEDSEEPLSEPEVSRGSEKALDSVKSKYGTRHVLVLSDMSPSLKTTDLEKLFVDFKDNGFIIRWINPSTALAVFKTSSTALEAYNRVQCPFSIRVLSDDDDDDDVLLGSISARDLEPPTQRPKTSARTAQRLIAHSMGLKLPNSGFGSKELRDQEATRRNRIVSRQKLRNDAWGDD